MIIRLLSSSRTRGVFAAAAAVGLVSSVTGCGLGGGAVDSASASHVASASSAWGNVHGGQQPVTGATITLYAAGVNTPGSSTGYGSGATPLATTTTDNTGSFNIPAGTYTCPASSPQTYIVATGGNPGLTGVNPNITLIAALGTCPAGGNLIATVPFININEVTTVAAVWALQQFMAPPSAANVGAPQIGAPNTTYSNGLSGANALSVQSAVVGMNNAFITAKILADVATGQTPNTNYSAYATPESSKINTLADILSYCVNSDPTSSAHCQNLGTATTPTGQTTAVDTAQSAWYMAQNPTYNLPTLYNYISASGTPFQPYMSVPGGVATAFFNDTTIAINYAPLGPNTVRGGANVNDFALANASDVAIDMYGNAWFVNRGQFSSFVGTPNDGFNCTSSACNTQDISELGVDGSVLVNQIATYNPSTTGGASSLLTTPPVGGTRTYGAFPGSLAIDLTNRAWATNTSDAPLGKSGTTTVTAGSVGVFPASTGPGLNAIGGNATLTNGTGYFVGAQPFGLAIDGSNNVFMSLIAPTATATYEGLSLAKMSATDGSSYTVSTGSAASTLPIAGQTFLDIDTNPSVTGGVVWAADYLACSVTGQLYSGTQSTTGNVTNYGLISQYAGGSVAALADSEQATAISNASTGAGTSVPVAASPYGNTGNCGNTTSYVGQVQAASMANPFALAVDRNNGVWITDQYNTSTKNGFDGLTYLSPATSSAGLVPSSYYLVNGVMPSSPSASSPTVGKSGTSLIAPARLAVDGNNTVWVSNSGSSGSLGSIAQASFNSQTNTISLLTPGQGGNPVVSGTTTQFGANTNGAYGIGYQHNFATPTGIAIDSSGNVWVANQSNNGSISYLSSNGSRPYTGLSTTVIVGAAGPVITPKALAAKYQKIGAKP